MRGSGGEIKLVFPAREKEDMYCEGDTTNLIEIIITDLKINTYMMKILDLIIKKKIGRLALFIAC